MTEARPATPFRPAAWLRGPHAQTIGARLLRSRRGVRLKRERIDTPDGDFLDLDWTEVDGVAPRAVALCLVLHGLEGSARSTYALETYRQLGRRGVAAVGLNFRSCGGVLNRQPRLYHSGETGDLAFVLELLRERAPDRPLGVIGFSLGGNVLLKYLGECGRGDGRRTPVDAAAAVSVPYDLAAGAAHMERGLARVYVRRLLQSLQAKVRAKAALLRDRINTADALAARTFRAFDDAATAPLHGYRDADDYYRRASSGPLLPWIRVPTRLVHALDDPFLPARAVPDPTATANPHLGWCIERSGGHVGFVEGPPWAPRFWAERSAAAFVAHRLRMRGRR